MYTYTETELNLEKQRDKTFLWKGAAINAYIQVCAENIFWNLFKKMVTVTD